MNNTRIYSSIKTVNGPTIIEASLYMKDASTMIYVDNTGNLMFKDKNVPYGANLYSITSNNIPYIDGSLGKRDASISFLNTNKASISYVDSSLFVRDASLTNLYQTRASISYTDASLLLRDASVNYAFNKIKELYIDGGNGLISGCAMTINADTTKFDVASGILQFTSYSDVTNPALTFVTFPPITGISVTNIGNNATYVGIDQSGNVLQSSIPFTSTQARSIVPIGVLVHSNHTSINVVNMEPTVITGIRDQFDDLMGILGILNISGNVISANGANLQINKSQGYIFKRGIGFGTVVPNELLMPSLIGPANIRYRLSNGTEYVDTSVIELSYQDSATTKAAIPVNKFSIQRIVLFPSNLIRIQYGTGLYNTIELAAAAINTEAFTLESNMASNGLLRAYLIVSGVCTSLQDTVNARFINADKFGMFPTSIVGGSSTLQQAYNNSVIPQIVTDVARGSLVIKNGTTSNINNAVSIQDSSAVQQMYIRNDGYSHVRRLDINKDSSGAITIDGSIGWRDIIGSIIPRSGGGTPPSLAAFRGGSVMAYAFSAGDIIDNMTFHIPHDYSPNSDLYLHIHWGHQGTAISGSFVLTWKAIYSKGYTQDLFGTEITYVQTISTPDISTYGQYYHNVSEFKLSTPGGSSSQLNTTLIEPDGLIIAQLTATTIPTITGGVTNEPFIFLADVHYQSKQVSTRNRTPNFYI